MGWKFTFQSHEHGPKNIEDWKALILRWGSWSDQDGIWNERDEHIEPEWFWNLVENKQKYRGDLASGGKMVGGYFFLDRDFS